MTGYQPDAVDRQLLNLLQSDARYTAVELGEEIGVSDNTVHNRMERLEEAGVITGYSALLDHRETGLDLYFHFTCTARISDRSEVADRVAEIPEVVEVTELMTGRENLQVKMVAPRDEDITRLARQLDQLSLEIDDENMIRTERRLPLDYVEVGALFDAEE